MKKLKFSKWHLSLGITAVSFMFLSTVLYFIIPEVSAQEALSGTAELAGWEYYMAAALATGLSSIAAGIAVGQVGTASVAAISEKPELFGKVLIILGLSEGIAIYGLIISFVIIAAL